MKKEASTPQPTRIIRGRVVRAKYRTPECPDYKGNPLQEALPPLMDNKTIANRLKYYTNFSESQRLEPNHVRYLLIHNAMRFFAPLDVHIELTHSISKMLRIGYADRNPFKNVLPDDSSAQEESLDQYSDQYEQQPDQLPTTACGMSIIGPSGAGKSFSVERILGLTPQVIHHGVYKGIDFNCSQLAWLKVDCPHDANPKGLCLEIFRIVDKLLGTKCQENYGGKHALVDEALNEVKTIAANQYLGLLVIDEIQRLSLAKSNGAVKLLNFFGQLRNEIGVPVILIGNYKSLAVLSGDFSQMRRGTGQGDLIWDLMKEDKQWRVFCESLWRFQYTKKTCKLDDLEVLTKKQLKDDPKRTPKTLSGVLYEETQGIVDFAVKVYMFAQERAIDTKKEVITSRIIRSVAMDKLKIPREVLHALKTGDRKVLELYDDLYNKAYNGYLHRQENGTSEEAQAEASLEMNEKPEESAIENTELLGKSSPEAESLAGKGKSRSKSPSSAKRRKKVSEGDKGELPKLIDELKSKIGGSAYEALLQAGYIDLTEA